VEETTKSLMGFDVVDWSTLSTSKSAPLCILVLSSLADDAGSTEFPPIKRKRGSLTDLLILLVSDRKHRHKSVKSVTAEVEVAASGVCSCCVADDAIDNDGNDEACI
jgi:hypothetical protein